MSTPSTPSTPTPSALKIESTDIKTAPGVTLTDDQKTIVGSVLDLFKGKPSLKKLSLWDDGATFKDPITVATGRKEYAAQWYGLNKVFSQITQKSHEVTDSGNPETSKPILVDMKTHYKAGSTEKDIDSVIAITTTKDCSKITRVEDRWGGSIEDGAIKNALRRVNANSVPQMVSVPANDEEDAKAGFQ